MCGPSCSVRKHSFSMKEHNSCFVILSVAIGQVLGCEVKNLDSRLLSSEGKNLPAAGRWLERLLLRRNDKARERVEEGDVSFN